MHVQDISMSEAIGTYRYGPSWHSKMTRRTMVDYVAPEWQLEREEAAKALALEERLRRQKHVAMQNVRPRRRRRRVPA